MRVSRDLLMMNVMFETSVLSVNWRGSAVGRHSSLCGEGKDGVVKDAYPDWWDWFALVGLRCAFRGMRN